VSPLSVKRQVAPERNEDMAAGPSSGPGREDDRGGSQPREKERIGADGSDSHVPKKALLSDAKRGEGLGAVRKRESGMTK